MEIFSDLIFVCPLLFIAGIIDAIAGGGGIISLPAYIMTGMPLNVAYGCNKMQSCLGTATALYRYAKSDLVDVKPSLVSSVTAIAGSYISTQIMLHLDDSIKSIIIIVAMCFIITLTLMTNKISSGEETRINLSRRNVFVCLAAGLTIGLYDGFFGPGGGTVALMLFSVLFKYDFRTASGNGKIIIVVSNLIALINYIATGNILYEIAIPATISNMLGCWLGASLAVKNGKKLVKVFLIAVVVILLIQAGLKLV